jgi:uncharacterized protein (DUF885 family)
MTNPDPARTMWFHLAPAWAREMFLVTNDKLDNISAQIGLVTTSDQVMNISQQMEAIMAAVQVEQADLDTLATNLEAVQANLASEIQSLQQQLPQANLTGLQTALSDLQALQPPTPTPAPPTP